MEAERVKTIRVRQKSNGQEAIVNETAFDSEQHEKMEEEKKPEGARFSYGEEAPPSGAGRTPGTGAGADRPSGPSGSPGTGGRR